MKNEIGKFFKFKKGGLCFEKSNSDSSFSCIVYQYNFYRNNG